MKIFYLWVYPPAEGLSLKSLSQLLSSGLTPNPLRILCDPESSVTPNPLTPNPRILTAWLCLILMINYLITEIIKIDIFIFGLKCRQRVPCIIDLVFHGMQQRIEKVIEEIAP